jgi:protein tyrosine phosphatase (PTP) superfamily phosphohydrolase (DUF442 family)
MFHGAVGVTVGGAQMHKDEADLLDKINADMKTQLVTRYGLKPETVDEWFSEGREGWLNATDAKSCGMVHEIIGEDAPAAPKVKISDIDALATKGMKIAACAAFDIEQPSQVDTPLEADASQTTKPDTAGEAAPLAGPAPGEPLTITDEALAMQAELEKFQARIAELTTENEALKAEAEKARAEARAQQSAKDRAAVEHGKALDAIRAELATVRNDFESQLGQKQKQNDELAKRLNRLTVAALTPSPEVKSWAEAMQHCGGDYTKARREFPSQFAQMIQAAKGKR